MTKRTNEAIELQSYLDGRMAAANMLPVADKPASNPYQIPGVAVLAEMLSVARPHDSKEDSEFCAKWIAPLGAKPDAFGNYLLRIGDSPLAWSSHTDTVAHAGGRQRIHVAPDTVRLAKRERAKQSCLGADCTAGVWLMREMILARVPRFYMFHRGEERGGLGSNHIARKTPHILEGIKSVVAFDRRGTRSVITHQAGGRCCSESFSESFAAALGMSHESDSGGSFTDSANYTGLVGECSNLSVGYYNEHSPQESIDLPYLLALRDSLVAADFSALRFEREAGEEDYESSYTVAPTRIRGTIYEEGLTDDSMYQLVRWNPTLVGALLESYGIDAVEVADYVYEQGGQVPMAMLDSPDTGRRYQPDAPCDYVDSDYDDDDDDGAAEGGHAGYLERWR